MKSYAKITKGLSLSIILCLGLTACGHEHTFTEANCTTLMTCTECGEIQGEALGHTFVDATCTEPKKCSLCNITEGEALGHKWIEATTEAPKTCEVCALTEGEPLEPEISLTVNSTHEDIVLGDDEYKGDDPSDVGIPSDTSESTELEGVDLDGDGKISQSEHEIYETVFKAAEEAAKKNGMTTTPDGGSTIPGPTGQQGNLVPGGGTPEGEVTGPHIEWGAGDYSGLEGGTVY